MKKRLEYLSNYFIISLLVSAHHYSAFFIRNRILEKLQSELRNERLESEQNAA
ncbi:MAG: hypothetical protein R2824_28465 [Saprospiraceae bacterium]